MIGKHQAAEASGQYGTEAVGQAQSLVYSNMIDHTRIILRSQNVNTPNVGWISVSASTGLTVWQGLVDALSLIHPTDELILAAA